MLTLDRILPANRDDREHVVYWITDETCVRPGWDGYIGVTLTERYHSRSLEHRRSKRFRGKKIDIRILARGYAETCYCYEAVLRPHANIGWNIAPGGARGHKLGIPRSVETKRKIGAANRGNSRPDLAARNSARKGMKRGKYVRTSPYWSKNV